MGDVLGWIALIAAVWWLLAWPVALIVGHHFRRRERHR